MLHQAIFELLRVALHMFFIFAVVASVYIVFSVIKEMITGFAEGFRSGLIKNNNFNGQNVIEKI